MTINYFIPPTETIITEEQEAINNSYQIEQQAWNETIIYGPG